MTFDSVYSSPKYIKILYNLMRERSEEDSFTNISHRRLPSYSEHEDFYNSKPYALWLIPIEGDKFLGSLNLTNRNEIGLVLFKQYRSQGYGKRILSKFLEEYKPLPERKSLNSGKFLANINPQNKASIRLFEKAGFKHIQNTYEI